MNHQFCPQNILSLWPSEVAESLAWIATSLEFVCFLCSCFSLSAFYP